MVSSQEYAASTPQVLRSEGAAGSAPVGLPGGRQLQRIGEAVIPEDWQVFRDGVYKFNGKKFAELKKAEAAAKGKTKVQDEVDEDLDRDDDDPDAEPKTNVVAFTGWLKPGLDRAPTTKQRQTLDQITRAPLWISRFGKALDRNGEERIELSAMSPDGLLVTQWVSRAEIATQAKLLEAAGIGGLPVNQTNVAKVIEYLDACLYENGRVLDKLVVAQRTGLYELGDGDFAWLLGATWLGKPDLKAEYDGLSIQQLGHRANAFAANGSLEAWVEKLREVDALGPVARWTTYSVFAAPLIRVLNWRTFFVHHFTTSLSGKTAAARFAMSAFGPSDKLLMTWDGSDVALAESFGAVSDAPVLFDELQMTTSKGERLSPIIYIMAGGSGRQRAGKSGGVLPKIMNWRSVIRTTGEQQILGAFGVDLGGMASRTIQISRPVFTKEEQAQSMYHWLDEGHYGIASLYFLVRIRELLVDADKSQWLRNVFTTVQATLREREVPSKLCGHIAIVATAQAVARCAFFDLSGDAAEAEIAAAYEDGIEAVVGDRANNNEESTLLFHAGSALRDLRDENRRHWFDLRDPRRAALLSSGTPDKIVGVTTTTGETWVNQTAANNALRHANLTPSAVWDRLAGLGFLKRSRNGRGLTQVKSYNGSTNHVYVLLTSYFEPELELNHDVT